MKQDLEELLDHLLGHFIDTCETLEKTESHKPGEGIRTRAD